MASSAPTMPGFPVRLSPEEIDRELAAMWKSREGDEAGGVTRVALGNMIWLASERHREEAHRIFSRLVTHYPCRLILLEYHEDRGNPDIDAFVNAQCFISPDRRGEVCCEEIILRFGAAAFRHVANAVLSLLLPDVPTTFCYVSALPHRYEELLDAITAIADHTITEVTMLADPVAGLRELADSTKYTGTLSWFRYGPIREQVASVFDDAQVGGLLGRLGSVRIKWCGTAGDVVALTNASLLVGWMASRLGWKPRRSAWPFRFAGPAGDVTIEFIRCDSEDPLHESELIEIELRCTTGERVRLMQQPGEGFVERIVDCAACMPSGRSMYVKTQPYDEARALIVSLSSGRTNPVFDAAARMAAPVLEAALERGTA